MSSNPEPGSLDALIRKLESIATLSAEEREAIDGLPVTVRAL
ncbi:hypothetical protein [Methylobacterium sp.]